MKIWCCLCFTGEGDKEVEEEEQVSLDQFMRGEEILGNDVFPEGNGGDDDDSIVNDNEPVGAAIPWGLPAPVRDQREQFRMFEEMVEAVRLSGLPPWRSSMIAQSSRWSEGESSSGAFVLVDEDQNSANETRDSHNKRAKVESEPTECHYLSVTSSNTVNLNATADIDYNNIQCTPVQSNNEMYCDGSVIVGSDDYKPPDHKLPKDEDKKEISKSEDVEVRMDLTDDLLHMVFSFLDHHVLCRAARVCRQWRSASSHEDFWRCLNLKDRKISMQQFEDVCQRYPNVTTINLSGVNSEFPNFPSVHSLAMKAVQSFRNIKDLTLGRGGQLGDSFFHALSDCSALKRLNINDATLGNGIQEIPINHDKLVHLQLTKCRVMRISVRCPQLEKMSLKRSNMAQAVLFCPLMQKLNIGSCHKLPDAAIRLAATSCPQLMNLDVSNCSCVSDETLREIALACGNLRFLDASYCPNISLESVRLPMLTVLKLHNCEGITSASMTAISYSNLLEVLELDNCSLLSSVSLELPRLQNIRLVHCRKFADFNLRSIMLSSILVSNCPALHRINITSNSLQKLVLQKQDSLTTLALQCQSLQEVDLSDCESLSNSICDVFSDGGGCPMLRSLVLDNCESLTAVRFFSTTLASLSLVSCRAITAIELTCPNLEKVCLDGCDHLESAAFSPVGLRSLNLGICPKLNQLAIKAPQMVSLELKGCGVLFDASIYCPLLTSLDASFCSQLTDECLSATAASCQQIEALVLMSCPSIGSDGLCSLRWLPSLTVLDLSYTFLTSLQPVFESCLQLKVLKLQACKYLTDTSLEPLYKGGALPALQELDLSYGTLCQTAIEELLTRCTHLTHLSLNGCVNMHDLNWGSTGVQLSDFPNSYVSSGSFENVLESSQQPNRLLQNLNCVGCPNIKKVLIPPMARCSHLSSLNISLSAHLKEVNVACFNLCFLNLSNCCSLEILKLECPRLSSLFLQSCNIDEEAIEAAISKCSMLETLDVRFCPKMSSASMGKFRAACPSLKRIFSSLSTW